MQGSGTTLLNVVYGAKLVLQALLRAQKQSTLLTQALVTCTLCTMHCIHLTRTS